MISPQLFIIATEFCERLAFYCISGNLLYYLQKRFKEPNERADVIASAWVGMCYVTPLFGGLLADRYMRRSSVIVVFCVIYLVGLVLLVVDAAPNVHFNSGAATSAHRTLFYVGLAAVALGSGGIKPNASTLGASQFPPDADKSSFFNWFYFAINLGAGLASTVGSYLFTFGIEALGGEAWSFCVGWSLPTVALAIGLATFWSGRHRYKQEPRKDVNALWNDCQRLIGLLLMCGQPRRYHTAPTAPMDVSGRSTVSDGSGSGSSVDGLIPSSGDSSPVGDRSVKKDAADDDTIAYADEDEPKDDNSSSSNNNNNNNNNSSNSSNNNNNSSSSSMRMVPPGTAGNDAGEDTDHDKALVYPSLLTVLPFLALMVPYWGVYVQMNTAFQNQGCQMNRIVQTGGWSTEIPVSALQAFDTFAVLVLVPVFEGGVYPLFARMGRPLSLLQRMAGGFAVAGLAMAAAAAVEAPPTMYFAEYEAASTGGATVPAMSPCQSEYDYSPRAYYQWLSAAGTGHVKPTMCSHAVASGSCLNYLSLLPPRGSMLFNGTASTATTACYIVTCEPLPLASSLSSLYQIPQYALVGASEVLASVAALEFFFSQTRPTQRGFMQSLNLLTTAIGSFAIIPLVLLVNARKGAEWVPSNLDFGFLERYFAVLSAIMGVCTVAVMWRARKYRYVGSNDAGRGRPGASGRARAESSAPLVVSSPSSPSSRSALRRRRVSGDVMPDNASADDVEARPAAEAVAVAAEDACQGADKEASVGVPPAASVAMKVEAPHDGDDVKNPILV